MIGFRIKDAQALFFDRKAVTAALDVTARKVLSKIGAFVRRTAQRSIRQGGPGRKGISRPGRPPRSHNGLLKRFLYFLYDPTRKSVVVGPAKLAKPAGPVFLENGGMTTLIRRGRRVRAKYRPRPFMGPALERERPKFAQMWRDQLSK